MFIQIARQWSCAAFKAVLLSVALPASCCLAQESMCGVQRLPNAIQSVQATSYERWELVTADLLSPDVRKMWEKEMAGACPGFVGGRFTGPAKEYAVN
jgi:hypothetical protein